MGQVDDADIGSVPEYDALHNCHERTLVSEICCQGDYFCHIDCFFSGLDRPLGMRPASGPVDKRCIKGRNREFEDILDQTELNRRFQIHDTPPDNK